MEPLPFFSLVLTRGPGTHVNPNKPVALGVVLGRSAGVEGWGYSVLVGEQTYAFSHDELIPLGCILDQVVIFGTTEDLEALPMSQRVVALDQDLARAAELRGVVEDCSDAEVDE